MKNLRFIVAIATLLTIFEKASAQYYFYDSKYYDSPVLFEFGGSFGMMNCLTDVGGNQGVGEPFVKDLNTGNFKPNGSIYFSAMYKYAVALRLEATFGTVTAYDSIAKPYQVSTEGRYERNLNFRSKISEFSLIAEFHPLYIFIDWPAKDRQPPRLSPYLAVGVGVFSFNPQGKLGNNWIDLHPLSLEGQGFPEYPNRKPYKLTQMNVPLGGGVKYELSSLFNLRLEFLHRILFTDYLDDVSTRYINKAVFQNHFSGAKLQNALDLSSNDRVNPGGPTGMFRKTEGGIRGNSNDKDSYFTFNLKIGFVFGRERTGGGTPRWDR